MTEDNMHRAEQYNRTHVPELYIEGNQPQQESRVEPKSDIVTVVSHVHETFTALRDGTFFKNPLATIFQEAAQLSGPEWRREVIKRLDLLSYRSEQSTLLASLESAKASAAKLDTHLNQLLQLVLDNPRLSRSQRHQLENRIAAISRMIEEHIQQAAKSAPLYEALVESIRSVIEQLPAASNNETVDTARFAQTWSAIRSLFKGNKAITTVGSAALVMSSFSVVSAQDGQQPTWNDHLENAINHVENMAETAQDAISQLLDQITTEFHNLQSALSFSFDHETLITQIEALGIGELSDQILAEFNERTANLDLAADLEAQTEEPIGTATLARGFSTINIRQMPATGSTEIVGQLTGNNSVEVLDDTVEGEMYQAGGVSSNNWVRVRLNGDVLGYIWSGALNIELNQTEIMQPSPVPEPLPTATPDTVETSEVPESILNIPIKFVSTDGTSSVSPYTLGQLAEVGAIDANAVRTSIDYILSLGLPPEVLNYGNNLYLLYHTTESFVGAPDPTLTQVADAIRNARIITFQTAETVQASDGFTHQSGELLLTVNGTEPMYIGVGQVFTELRLAQEQFDLGAFSTSRESSLLVPDTSNEIINIVDTATGQTTAILDLRALRFHNGTYGPGVINIVAGIDVVNVVRDESGEIVAVETPEGPIQLEEMGSVRVAKRTGEDVERTANDVIMSAPRPSGAELAEVVNLNNEYYLHTILDNPSAPRYKWENDRWRDQHPGRDRIDALLPGGNTALLAEHFGNQIVGWNQEMLAYERNDGKYFYPGLGTTEQNGSYDISDLESGWVTTTEQIQSSNFVPGESGLRWIINLAENHPVYASVNFDSRIGQQQYDILISWILDQYPQLNGWTVNSQILPEDISERSGFSRPNILDINVVDMFASGETHIPEEYTLFSRLSVTLNNIERTDSYFTLNFFGSLISSIDEYVRQTERPMKVEYREIATEMANSLQVEPFDFLIATRK